MKVSVYCLAFNHENYISQTLEGFINQNTDFKYEVFVHDDASTDGTSKIIQEYEKKYPEIIKGIYQNENQYSKGVNVVATYIMPRVCGKYVALCEGDDYWSDVYKLQKMVDFLDNHLEYSACVHNTVVLDMATEERRLMNPIMEEYDLKIEHVLTEGGSDFHTSSLVYRFEYMKKMYSKGRPEFFEIVSPIEDYPTAIYLTLQGKVRYLPDVMSVYRYGTPGSWTSSLKNIERFKVMRKKVISMLENIDQFMDYQMHNEIQAIVEERYWEILMISLNLEILKEEAIRKIFQKQSFLQKVKIIIKLLFLNKYRMRRCG